MCTCGCSENMHVDGCEQCFNGACGCREFEENCPEEDEPEEMAYSDCCNARATSVTPDGSIVCTKCHKECSATELPTNNEVNGTSTTI